MNPPRTRYSRQPLDSIEEWLAKVSEGAALVAARVRNSRHKRSIPGLLAMGEGGIAENFNLTPARVKRDLRELDKARIVIRDQRARLIYVVGSVEQDGPTTLQAVTAFRSQLAEMPPDSAVTIEVKRAIEVFLADPEREKVRTWWLKLQGIDAEPATTAVVTSVTGAVTDAATGSLPYPTPETDTGNATDPERSTGRSAGGSRSNGGADSRHVPSHPERRRPAAVLDGTLPRDHVSHAECSPNLAWCVPAAVHAKLASKLSPRYQGERADAERALRRWYPVVWATLAPTFVMRDAFRFWEGRFDAEFATKEAPPPSANRRPELTSQVPDRAETRRKYLEG